MEYNYYGHNEKEVKPIAKGFERILNQKVMYDYMSHIWCKESCAPRMRGDWSEDNKTLGQCSITSFLIQDIFGGKVYGVPLEDGSFHCYNVINGVKFDLTSEQFGNIVLDYSNKYPQKREEHFANKDKYQRYLLIKRKLINTLLLENNNEFAQVSKPQLSKQEPFMMVITCSDSRVIPERIFNLSFGDVFVIRTAGNVINDGELASIEYGIKHLKIKYVLVLGHANCGAIHACIMREKGQYLDPILNRISHNIGSESDEVSASKINAHKESLYLKEKFPNEDVIFTSGFYDIKSNKVEFYK